MSVDLTQLTAHLSTSQQEAVKKAYRQKAEHPTAAFLWCFFLGTCGAHRFYLRQWGAGLARLIIPLVAAVVIVLGIALQWPPATVAAVAIALLLIALIWEIIDLFRIDHEVYERNLRLAEELIAGTLLADQSVEQQALGRMEILMGETEQASATAAHQEEVRTADEAAAAVPEPVAAASETAAPGTDETAEEGEAREMESVGAGAASVEYVSHTVSEVSADLGETKQGEPLYSPQHDWYEAAIVHAEDENVQTSEQSGEETVAEPGALGVAAAGVGAAVVGGLALDELVTRSHEETDHGATDTLETFTTLSAAESEQKDEAVAAETEAAPETPSTEPPTTAESEALTWPDHPPVQFDEPAPAVAPESAPDATGFDAAPLVGAALGGAALAGGAAALVAGEHEATAASTPRGDVTDMGTPSEAAPAIADIEGATPHFVTLPGFADVTSADTPTLQVEPAADATPATDEALLLLVPDEAANPPLFEAEPLAAEEDAPSPESYIPPTVPVVSVPAAPVFAEAAPSAFDTGPIMPPPPAPENVAEPESEPAHEGGETLAELAGLAGGVGLAAGAAEMLHAHDEPAMAQEPVAVEPQAEPVRSTAPAAVEEPVAAPPLAETAAPVAAAEAPAEPPRHRMRRIREYLQVKHGDQAGEELVAEELIEVDDDPEPVRVRLREQLHQQAIARGLE